MKVLLSVMSDIAAISHRWLSTFKLIKIKMNYKRVGREAGGGIGMGKTCEPKAFSFQCMTKFTTNKINK